VQEVKARTAPQFHFMIVLEGKISGEYRIFHSYQRGSMNSWMGMTKPRRDKKWAGGVGYWPPEEIECGGGSALHFLEKRVQDF